MLWNKEISILMKKEPNEKWFLKVGFSQNYLPTYLSKLKLIENILIILNIMDVCNTDNCTTLC